MDRPIIAKFTHGFFHEVTYQHPLFVNNSNNNHYFKNHLTNNRALSTNDQLNRKTNHLINNSINDGDLPNSETAPLSNNEKLICHYHKRLNDQTKYAQRTINDNTFLKCNCKETFCSSHDMNDTNYFMEIRS